MANEKNKRTGRIMSNELQSICEKIVREVSPVQIILYGTKFTPSGDRLREANLCIVVETEAKEAERRLYRSLELDFPFNLLVYNKEIWEKLLSDSTSYASSIQKKGVVLYGKA